MQSRRAFLGSAAALLALPALAADSKPIRMIVPYPAGGPTDATARIVAELVKDSLGVVVIDNKPGAGGNIGADILAKSPPDGLTIGIAAFAPNAVNPWLYGKLPYEPIKDFAMITQMVSVPLVLVMNSDAAARLQINTLEDLISYGRKNPGRLNFGSAGNGSPGHLAAEMLKQEGRFSAVHIPYGGGNPAQVALLGGQVDCNFDNLGSAASNIAANKVKTLAVTSPRRLSSLPNVPTVAETIKGFSMETWWGLAAPAGTPAATILKLNQAFVAALQSPEAKKRYAPLMIEPVSGTPEEFAHLVKSELDKYERFIKASGIRLE